MFEASGSNSTNVFGEFMYLLGRGGSGAKVILLVWKLHAAVASPKWNIIVTLLLLSIMDKQRLRIGMFRRGHRGQEGATLAPNWNV